MGGSGAISKGNKVVEDGTWNLIQQEPQANGGILNETPGLCSILI